MEQTKTAVESIGAIVNQVVGNTDNAVAAMEQNVWYTQSGMEHIERANESTALITASAILLDWVTVPIPNTPETRHVIAKRSASNLYGSPKPKRI